ncbi:MAG: 1-acyl-sn-glycerol-3-phosphate acyltransferase [Clostridia bacterium]|nr:1-acyl-sn-glycerol-3-phosphate acyltransferase [Clostridia bacterium]
MGIVRAILTIFLTLFFKVELVNKENIPEKGAAILCANHIGELDMFFIGYRLKRIVHYMAKEELFRYPIIAGIIRWLGAFPVKRGRADVGAIKTAFKLLDEGHILGIFAEGTRTRNRNASNVKVNPGVAMIAVKSGAPIVPVAIEGNQKLFSKIRVVFGKPYYLDIDRSKKYSNEELVEISRGIMGKVYGLLGER